MSKKCLCPTDEEVAFKMIKQLEEAIAELEKRLQKIERLIASLVCLKHSQE